jgi:hypothetical protein
MINKMPGERMAVRSGGGIMTVPVVQVPEVLGLLGGTGSSSGRTKGGAVATGGRAGLRPLTSARRKTRRPCGRCRTPSIEGAVVPLADDIRAAGAGAELVAAHDSYAYSDTLWHQVGIAAASAPGSPSTTHGPARPLPAPPSWRSPMNTLSGTSRR